MTQEKQYTFLLGAGFAAVFGLYLFTAGPSLVPYRDAGELAAAGPTLGVLHPTSYPLYSLVSRLVCAIPLANPGYRLNIFSGLAMSIAWFFLYQLFEAQWNREAAMWTILWAACSYEFWWHALVSEMYTFNLFFLSLLLWTIFHKRTVLAGFIFGLGLANRSDLLLTLPVFIILCWPNDAEGDKRRNRRKAAWALTVAGLGLTLYAYLPLRALQHPWLNWDDPSTLERFIRSILRQAYGGTLDLLSTSYFAGENFIPETMRYLQHLFRDFTPVAWVVAGGGLWQLWSRSRRYFAATLLGWIITGPMFIWIANLPPNPHAVAILEAAYLVPDLFFVIWIAAGVALFLEQKNVRWPFRICLLGCFVWQIPQTYHEVQKRNNFVAIDYILNVAHSQPPHSIVVARSDVPIFNLFYGHYIYPKPVDRWPVAQGMVSALWYQSVVRSQAPEIHLSPLKSNEDWKIFKGENSSQRLFATPDLDWPDGPRTGFTPMGMLSEYGAEETLEQSCLQSDALLNDIYRHRGIYRYGHYRDFFTNEIVEGYAQGFYQLGGGWLKLNQLSKANAAFESALAFKPDHAYAALQKGYVDYLQSRFKDALRDYGRAADLFQELDDEAVEWKSLGGVRDDLRRDGAQALAQAGVVTERLGDTPKAQSLYEHALTLDPGSADAQYNLAVLYWKKGDWTTVVDHLQALAHAHPEDPRWKPYLGKALEHLQRH